MTDKTQGEGTVLSSVFERHTQTALVLLLVALLIWVGDTTQRTSLAVAEMRVEVAFLKATSSRPPYQYDQLSSRLNDHSSRLDYLESRLDKVIEENRNGQR